MLNDSEASIDKLCNRRCMSAIRSFACDRDDKKGYKQNSRSIIEAAIVL